jgi:adenylate cyclase
LLAYLIPARFEHFGLLVFDTFQRAAPRAQGTAPLAVVDIDEASLRAIGQWPWPRRRIATMVDRLGALGAAAIVFDVTFAEPDRLSLAAAASELRRAGAEVVLPGGDQALVDDDMLLASTFQRNSVVAGIILTPGGADSAPDPKAGFAFGGSDPRSYLPNYPAAVRNLGQLEDAAAGIGVFSFQYRDDGVVRRVPLIARSGDVLLPALAVEALRVAQGARGLVVRSTGASGEMEAGRPGMMALKVGEFEVPTSDDGTLWIYFSGMPDLQRFAAERLLGDDPELEQLRPLVEGRIVLIGTSAAGLRDLVVTPLRAGVPGVEVHAEVIDQIMSGKTLVRPDWASGLELSGAAMLGAAILAVLTSLGPAWGAAVLFSILAAAGYGSWSAFENGLLLAPVLPGMGAAAAYSAGAAAGFLSTDRERRFVRRAFAQYLAPSLVDQLVDTPERLRLGGEVRVLTVLFLDIRKFSAIAESMGPQELTALLNRFLTPMTDVLLSSSATVDKYIGDAILAFWNAPLAVEGHPRRACETALAMLEALNKLNQTQDVQLRIGIGLNTGPCCVGNLGSEQRFAYSAIGDAVNIASRLEGLTKFYGVEVLVSEDTAIGAGDFAFVEVDRVRVVGRSNGISIYALLGGPDYARSPDFREFSERHSAFLAAYRRLSLDEAEACLARARSVAAGSLSRLTEIYAERLQELRRNPRVGPWDGVYDAESK